VVGVGAMNVEYVNTNHCSLVGLNNSMIKYIEILYIL